MLRTLLALILALAVSAAGAQIVNRPVAAGSISNPGTSLPSTCAVGYLYFKSDSTAGQNLHLCTAANTWTQMTGGNLANPVTVLQGGTGRATSTTAYGLLAAGTTATGTQQTLAAGATTDILVGGGASALPVWTTATGSGAPVRATSPVLVTPTLGAASATSINFGGTTLSTYAEGTWTPAVGGTATYTSQDGTYIKIGKIVVARFSITINAIGTGSTTVLSGLPFTAVTTSSTFTAGGGNCYYWGSAASTFVHLSTLVGSNSTSVSFGGLTAGSATMSTGTAVFGAGTRVDCQVIYASAT